MVSFVITRMQLVYFSWFDFFFKFSSFTLLKERHTPLSNSKSVMFTKNVIYL